MGRTVSAVSRLSLVVSAPTGRTKTLSLPWYGLRYASQRPSGEICAAAICGLSKKLSTGMTGGIWAGSCVEAERARQPGLHRLVGLRHHAADIRCSDVGDVGVDRLARIRCRGNVL